MQWRAGITGAHEDLKLLARRFDDDPKVVQEENDFYLEWSEFQSLTDPDEVRSYAQEALKTICGIVELDYGLFDEVGVGAIFKQEEEETHAWVKTDTIRVHATQEMREALGMGELDIIDEKQALKLALEDQAVYELLEYWERGDSWGNLYKILEFIEAQIENDVAEVGWITENERRNFRRTANDKRIIGIEARHGTPKNRSSPSQPMSHSDARDLIRAVSIEWFREKRN